MKLQATVFAFMASIPLLASASQNAPLAVEATSRGGAKLVSLDFETAGDVAAFTFRVVLPEGAKRIDTSRCVSELPKGYTGVCSTKDNFVAVTAYSTDGKAAPAGLLSVGRISYVGGNAKAATRIDAFEASTSKGESASVGAAKVESLD